MSRRIMEIGSITLRGARQIDVPAIHSDDVSTFFPTALRIDRRATGVTAAQARQERWNASCDHIVAEMQPWLAAGWLPACDLQRWTERLSHFYGILRACEHILSICGNAWWLPSTAPCRDQRWQRRLG